MRTKEQTREYNRRYYEKNKERIKEKERKKYQEEKEKVLERVKNYRENNRELLKEKGKEYNRRKPELRMLNRAKQRAKNRGLDFDIEEADVVIPEKCPLLGVELKFCYDLESVDGKRDLSHSPSLDRKDPSKGYVKGNVWVISYKANTIKSNATIEELERITQRLKELL